jgi:ribonuclease HI
VCLIYSDSAYCVNMFNDWISTWASNGWTNSKKEIVKNYDLVKKLYEYKKIDFPNFQVLKIKGHADNIGNELADAYAVSAYTSDASKLAKILKENDITLAVE